MSDEPRLENAMTPFPYSVEPEAAVSDAVEFLRKHKIRHLPVMERGTLKGVVTDRDIKLMLGPDFAYPDANEIKVRDVMVEECYVVDVDTPLHTVLRQMADRRFGSAIVTRRGKLAGVFTSTDACRLFADHLEGVTVGEADDEDGDEWAAP
jgi:acetoin utilization protein AcuB